MGEAAATDSRMMVPIADIRRDGGTQLRESTDAAVVDDYAEAMTGGAPFPAVVVFDDGEVKWLADGFHRAAAAEQSGETDILTDVREGSLRDALLFAVEESGKHSPLRRTNADKRKAVEVLLADDEWCQWSDREIARRAGVSDKTVGRLRPAAEVPQLDTRKGADGKTYDVTNIGKTPREPKPTLDDGRPGNRRKRPDSEPPEGEPMSEPCASAEPLEEEPVNYMPPEPPEWRGKSEALNFLPVLRAEINRWEGQDTAPLVAVLSSFLEEIS